MNIFKIPGRFVGLLIVFGCCLILIYKVGENYAYSSTVHHDRLQQQDVQAGSLCPKPQRLLKTSGPSLCLSYHNIFLVETAHSRFLNPRQACAVESAARHHPSYDVMVIMTPNEYLDFNNRAMKVLNFIKNVKIVKVDLAKLFDGSPYYEWYKSKIIEKSPYKVPHMSDGLRFFLLWTFGGMYLDTDVVVLKPLTPLRNTVVSDDGHHAGSSVMFFDRGHPILSRFVDDFTSNYNPAEFAANGPRLIHRNIMKYCGVENVLDTGGKGCNVGVLPMERAFPIPFQRWKEYFEPSEKVVNVNERFNSSYLIHVWNFLSSKESVVIGSNSLYELAMKEHCPMVYEYAKELKRV